MLVKSCVVFYCWMTILCAVLGDDFDIDYYGNRAIRSGNQKLDCDSDVFRYHCSLKCGDDHACLFGKCLCLESENESIMEEDVEDHTIEQNKEPEPNPLTDFSLRPTLRHHIAHFCPNLEEARKCIRKCMQLGKPAFCGKDHVCYCGHNYGSPSKNKENPEETYNQFRDLYEKYFGKNGRSD